MTTDPISAILLDLRRQRQLVLDEYLASLTRWMSEIGTGMWAFGAQLEELTERMGIGELQAAKPGEEGIMTPEQDYERNRAHRQAVSRATRRAQNSLNNIRDHTLIVERKLKGSGGAEASDADILASQVHDLTKHLAVLELLAEQGDGEAS